MIQRIFSSEIVYTTKRLIGGILNEGKRTGYIGGSL